MKFEMNRAWNDAMALLAANRQVVTIVAGVFFFLPYMVFAMLMPAMGTTLADPASAEQAYARLGEFYGQYWWLMIVIGLIQAVGMLGILALLTDHRRPTVGEALRMGAGKVLPYIAAYLIVGLALALLFIVLITAATAAGSNALAVVAVLLILPVAFYAMVKFSLIPPILVKEGVTNPVAALRRSWRMTKGNSLRLFFFYALLAIVLVILVSLLSMVAGLLFSVMGPEAVVFGNALISALMNAIWATGFLAVLSAVHDQLGGTSSAQIAETFE